MPLSIDSEYKTVTVTILKKQKKLLEEKGICRSRFLRQAIKAYQEGTFKYSYVTK